MSESHRVEEVFEAALQKSPGGECASYLDDACRDDADLRAAVERLLAAHARAGKFLEHPPTELLATSERSGAAPTGSRHDGTPDLVGVRIGPYKLLEEIGEGGMGVVYMAEQEKPLRRRVALKVIKPGLDSRQVVARFEAERQALALMDHPNIARVIDAGTVDGGRPYFVMELVRGVPITEFCDQNKLSVHERLKLFEQVCLAVQHAHQKGIIHRDIKPSNVLVTLNDDRAVPKVIDFGVSKAVNQQLTDKTLFTQFAQMIGTPLYMSPEQAQMTSLDVDTRTDVYALGVLLYELLTGTTPFDRHRLGTAAHDEVRRIIREEVPQRPSQRISTLGQQRTVVAAHRQAQPERLSQLVSGDLDWIVMKALEKDRTRRYDTVLGLAADVQRYLAHEPVEAGPPSATYRLRKFARRHRAVIATVGAIFGVLLLGIVASTWQAIRATRAEAQAETARAAATAQELKERDAKLLAEAEKRTANQQRDLAEDRQRRIERLAYPTQIARAKQLWERGEVAEAKALLDSTPANLQSFEYRYLHSMFEYPIVLRAHKKSVDGLAFSRDGLTLASTSILDSSLKIWDAASLHELRTLQKSADALSPDLRRIGTRTYFPKGVRVLDVETGRALCNAPSIDDPRFIRGGEQLAVKATSLRAEALVRFIVHGDVPEKNNESQHLAIWDVATGQLVRSHALPGGSLLLAISEDGRRYATADNEKVHIWETETNREVNAIATTDSPLEATAQFSGDGRRIAVFNTPSFIATVFDVDSGQTMLDGANTSPDHNELSTAGTRLLTDGPTMWDVDTGCVVFVNFGVIANIRSMASSADGRRIAAGLLNGNILIWNWVSGPDILTASDIRDAWDDAAFDFSHDGGEIATGHQSGEVVVWNTRVRSEPRLINKHMNRVLNVAFSSDGRNVTSASEARIDVTDVGTGQTISSVELQQDSQDSSLFPPAVTGLSNDGALFAREVVAKGDARPIIEIWATDSGKCVATLDCPNHEGTSAKHPRVYSKLAFSPDNRRVAAGYDDGRTVVWNVETAKTVFVSEAEGDSFGTSILDVTFSNDGNRIAACANGRSVIIWNIATGEQTSRIEGHIDSVSRVAYSPDDARLVTCSDDSTVRIWDPDLGVELLNLENPNLNYRFGASGTMLAFSPDGNTLAVLSRSGVRLLRARPPENEYKEDSPIAKQAEKE